MKNELCEYCGVDLGCVFNSIRAREYWVTASFHIAACDACILTAADEFADLGDERLVALRLFYVHRISLPKMDAAIAAAEKHLTPEEVRVMRGKRAEIFELHQAGELVASMRAGRELFALTAYVRDLPATELGKKMKTGRKPGTVGPIRRAVASYLKKHPAAKNEEIWQALAGKPPRGWVFMDNRLGRYIEGPAVGDRMEIARFRNICAEARKPLKK